MSKMPPTEKANLQNALDNTPSIPADSPPSYEHIATPPVITASTPTPSQPTTSIPLSIPSQNPLVCLSRLSSIPFTKYRVRDAKLSDDQSTLTTTSPELASTQYALLRFIHEQVLLPPKPLMVIKGTHLGSATQNYQPVVDFELKFNLTSMLDLVGDGDGDGATDRDKEVRRRIRVKPLQSSSGSSSMSSSSPLSASLEQWIKKFCEDKAENRR